jgi:hypothetical protein
MKWSICRMKWSIWICRMKICRIWRVFKEVEITKPTENTCDEFKLLRNLPHEVDLFEQVCYQNTGWDDKVTVSFNKISVPLLYAYFYSWCWSLLFRLFVSLPYICLSQDTLSLLHVRPNGTNGDSLQVLSVYPLRHYVHKFFFLLAKKDVEFPQIFAQFFSYLRTGLVDNTQNALLFQWGQVSGFSLLTHISKGTVAWDGFWPIQSLIVCSKRI